MVSILNKTRLFSLTAISLLWLASCAQVPRTYIPEGQSCNLDLYSYDLEVALPAFPKHVTGLSFTEAQERAIDEDRAPLLFLSGGSQHGAFGAGYLDQWAIEKGGLPEFSIVTGVSTGALQSTGAFINRPDLAVRVAAPLSESDILETYIDGTQLEGGLQFGAIRALISKGAVSDLIPLRRQIDALITPDILLEVAKGDLDGRKLYVGVTDFDTGGAVAIDMTALATLYKKSEGLQRETYKTCYREFLIASSIVPVAAKPVFIENRMFIDGGVRFGVFTEDIGELLRDRQNKSMNPPGMPVLVERPTPIHIVVNGDGVPSRRCGKSKEFCEGDRPKDIAVGPHKKWSFPSLAVRSVDLLSNQVSRLSIDRAINLERDFDNEVVFARINEAEKDGFEMEPDVLPDILRRDDDETRSCAAWRKVDDRVDQPVEFHARYMRCLIAYGRSVATQQIEAGEL